MDFRRFFAGLRLAPNDNKTAQKLIMPTGWMSIDFLTSEPMSLLGFQLVLCAACARSPTQHHYFNNKTNGKNYCQTFAAWSITTNNNAKCKWNKWRGYTIQLLPFVLIASKTALYSLTSTPCPLSATHFWQTPRQFPANACKVQCTYNSVQWERYCLTQDIKLPNRRPTAQVDLSQIISVVVVHFCFLFAIIYKFFIIKLSLRCMTRITIALFIEIDTKTQSSRSKSSPSDQTVCTLWRALSAYIRFFSVVRPQKNATIFNVNKLNWFLLRGLFYEHLYHCHFPCTLTVQVGAIKRLGQKEKTLTGHQANDRKREGGRSIALQSAKRFRMYWVSDGPTFVKCFR